MPGLKDKHIIQFWNGLFFLALVVFWRFFYVNHLLQKEQMQLFLLTLNYLGKHLSVQGGLAIYIGEFITQFFLNKWAAAILVSASLALLALGIQKVLKTISENGIFLFSWLPALGYHLLVLDPYYKFAGLVTVVLSVWSVVIYLKFKRVKTRILAGFILLILNYWFLGGAYILFTLSVILIELQFRYKQKQDHEAIHSLFLITAAYVLTGLIVPFLTRQFLVTDHLLSAYFSRAFYQFSFLLPVPIILILVSLPALLISYRWLPVKRSNILYGSIGVFLFVIFVLGSRFLPDFAEEKEMQYDNLVHLQKWEEIIELAKQEMPKGKQAKVALSLALAKMGQMSTLLFHFNPEPNDFFISFNIQGQAPMIANEPYFYLGLINFSKMLCVETIESTPDESQPVRAMQRLAEDYIISDEYKVAKRYLWYLEHTLFYRKWAKEAEQFLAGDKEDSHAEWIKLRKQPVHDDFYFQYERNDAALISLLRTDPHDKTAYEYLMSWYLLRKDFDSFLQYLPLVNSMNYDEFPLVFQEALAYIKTLFEEVPEGLNQYPVSDEVQQQLTRYAQAFQQGGNNQPAEMKKLFGNTYWYYVHFTDFENETSTP